jgi:hypothetical protein
MSKSMGRMIFVAFIWLFSLRYFLECMDLSQRSERLTINIAFWVLTVFVALDLFALVRNIIHNKTQQSLFNKKTINAMIGDKRGHLVVATILYIVLIPLTGFYVTSFAAFCVFSFILGTRSLIKMIVPGGIIMALIYAIFTALLQLSLPSGLFM